MSGGGCDALSRVMTQLNFTSPSHTFFISIAGTGIDVPKWRTWALAYGR